MESRGELALWAAALGVAAFGTWVMYDAVPGINWGSWTLVAAAGLFLFLRTAAARAVWLTSGIAVIIAFGAAITADPFIDAVICLSVILFLGLSMLLSNNPAIHRLTAAFVIPAPIVAFVSALNQSVREAVRASHLVRSERARSVLLGIVITAPVVVIFALLLSTADPVFAGWRDAVEHLLTSWAFLPRIFFFLGMLAITLGAYAYAAHESPALLPEGKRTENARWLGGTERLILISSVAALFWIFIGVQLSYFFGNLPRVVGSGMTFADYARRGFGELTIVATATVILILFGERFGKRDHREGQIRLATLALVIAVVFLLASAFNRVVLYESAYGFTTARLYAQCYMVVVAATLVTLAWQLRGELRPSSLFRTAGAVATIAFIILIYWNHEAWIADRNIDRLATTGRLDVGYLTKDLSPNAVPKLIERLPGLSEPFRTELNRAIYSRYTGHARIFDGRWYEWNLRRGQARDALVRLGVQLQPAPASP